VLLIAGFLLLSRKLSTREMLGLVDWHLLVLFAGLFIVTGALSDTGLPARALDAVPALDAPWIVAAVSLVGSNTVGNVPLVMLVLAALPHAGAGLLQALAVLSTLAGNLLIVGSIANIIVVEQARRQGVAIGLTDHARSGIPLTLAGMALAVLWLTVMSA
jgi:Na+/H+ antiporter NhaD/arsenite permease-like protein